MGGHQGRHEGGGGTGRRGGVAGASGLVSFRPPPVLFARAETTQQAIEQAFKDFTAREDVAVILINQTIASTIRHLIERHTKPIPAILEIPSKDAPYDPSQDSILARVKFMFGET